MFRLQVRRVLSFWFSDFAVVSRELQFKVSCIRGRASFAAGFRVTNSWRSRDL